MNLQFVNQAVKRKIVIKATVVSDADAGVGEGFQVGKGPNRCHGMRHAQAIHVKTHLPRRVV